MGIIKGLIFDGLNTLDYNIGITGGAVYNSPERDVEMVTVPGRNGAYSLDHGRFKNITVSYPAGAFDKDQPTFADKLISLRNELASRVGYKRLEDEYNPDEYRLAVYRGGLDVNPVHYSTAGQFDLVFDCKPQRFLKSGEVEQAIASGDAITNPTLFDAHPLVSFQASGDGSITIGDKIVNFYNSPIGVINLPYTVATTQGSSYNSVRFSGAFNSGDPITLKGAKAYMTFRSTNKIASSTFPTGQDLRVLPGEISRTDYTIIVPIDDYQASDFVARTSSTVNKSYTFSLTTTGGTVSVTINLSLHYTYTLMQGRRPGY